MHLKVGQFMNFTKEMDFKLSKKLEKTDHFELKTFVHTLPTNGDLKELYNKVVP